MQHRDRMFCEQAGFQRSTQRSCDSRDDLARHGQACREGDALEGAAEKEGDLKGGGLEEGGREEGDLEEGGLEEDGLQEGSLEGPRKQQQ